MSQVLTETRGGIRIVTLNRPERKNAFTPQMIVDLEAALTEAAGDAAVRAVILTGADGTFCVGGDVKAMNEGAGRDKSFFERRKSLRDRMQVSDLLHNMPKPTIAAIEGAAAGAGLSIALACDFRISSATAKITTAFAKVGLSGDFGGTFFLTQILGAAKARELYLFSPIISGKEAETIGMVSRSVDPGSALDEALAFAQTLASGATVALGRMKANLNLAAAGGSLNEVMDLEAENFTHSAQTADHKEAAAAFVEKRPPDFRGA
ncbi:enoyl-CoA hydratase-related protein [Pseudooceanicola sp. C21-150M6]|uniref:enoyl-CoA hydratase-related protein n=1 Tax=Pseudooceanicola sp. C21-150M6 TaxID=3434355 RepID=UPI003D7F6FE9